MIRFFRNIRQQLLGEGKTGKYLKYAIGEIILVVIGILIALQFNNWNERVKNDAETKEILQAIHSEFVLNKENLKTTIAGHEFCYRHVEELIEMFPIKVDQVNMDSLRTQALNSLGQWTFEPTQSRLKYLISSPYFGMIKDKELQTALLSWESTYEDYQEEEQKATDYNNEILFPYLNTKFPFAIEFSDPRYDRAILQSFEFENMFKKRKTVLTEILYNDTGELERLNTVMNNIITLTANYIK